MGLREAYHLPILILSPNTFRKNLMFTSDMCIISVVERFISVSSCVSCLPLPGLLGTFGQIPKPKPEGSTSPTPLFSSPSRTPSFSLALLTMTLYSAGHPWAVQVPPSLIEHIVATLYIITRPHLQPNKCYRHILCQRHIGDPIFPPTIPFPFFIFHFIFFSKNAFTAKD
jgi:hypothetical protein